MRPALSPSAASRLGVEMNDKTEQTVTDALPCPFCGSTQGFYVEEGSTFRWRVISCRNCGEGTEVRRNEPDSYITDWNAAAPYPAMLRKEIDTLRAQLAEAQAAQTINQYPPITTEVIYQHVQANQAHHFLRVSWKDGIDIEEPTRSVECLLHAYADAAREGWASPEEVQQMRAAIDAAKGGING